MQHMLAGAIAGISEHVAMYPMDTIKTRMQALGHPGQRVCTVCSTALMLPVHEFVRSCGRGRMSVLCNAVARIISSKCCSSCDQTRGYSRPLWWSWSYHMGRRVSFCFAGSLHKQHLAGILCPVSFVWGTVLHSLLERPAQASAEHAVVMQAEVIWESYAAYSTVFTCLLA